MTSADYSKLLAISVIAALTIAVAVPSIGLIGGATVLQKSDRLPIASPAAEPATGLQR